MKNNTRGWYYFEDGSVQWVNGFSTREKKIEIMKHGKIIKFIPTA